MTAIDPAAVHADPDGGIRWFNYPPRLQYANPVISVDFDCFWGFVRRAGSGCWVDEDPDVYILDPAETATHHPHVIGKLTRWCWTNAEHLYRVHSYDPNTDCYLLVWPD